LADRARLGRPGSRLPLRPSVAGLGHIVAAARLQLVIIIIIIIVIIVIVIIINLLADKVMGKGDYRPLNVRNPSINFHET